MSASRNIVAILILCICPITVFAQSEPASPSTGAAWGRVLPAIGDLPIRHARVELVSVATNSVQSGLTGDRGEFAFEGLEQVTYQVIVSAPGFQKLEATAEIKENTGPLLLRLRKIEGNASPINNDVVSVQELRMSGKAEKPFNAGTKLLLKGQLSQSIAQFTRAISRDPTYFRAWHNLGLAHLRLGHLDEAERALQNAIDLTGGAYAPAEFAMGMVLCEQQDYARAEQAILRGLEKQPGSATGKFYLAMVQFSLNRPVDAEKSAEQALLRNGNFPEAYFLLAAIHQREQNRPALERDLKEYLHLEPDGPHSREARTLLAGTMR